MVLLLFNFISFGERERAKATNRQTHPIYIIIIIVFISKYLQDILNYVVVKSVFLHIFSCKTYTPQKERIFKN